MLFLTLGIIISALGGLLLTLYIKKHKYSENHLVCPVDGNCEELTSGRFSKFLGIPAENLGIVYYLSIILIYTSVIFQAAPAWLLTLGVLMTGIGFAFSMYLSVIQMFVIKQWCTLCLGSAAIAFLMMVLAFIGYDYNFLEFIFTYRDLLKWIFVGAVAIGTVITTLHARIFISFLKDFEISRKEEARLEMFSHTSWLMLGIAFLSGIALALTDVYREYVDGDEFVVMIIIMGLLIAYEVIVNMIISPRLIGMHFGDHPELDDHAHSIQRKVAFGFMGVGVVSWYALLVFTVFDFFNYSSGQLFVAYGILVILAVAVTMLVEVVLYRKSLHAKGVLDKTLNDTHS